MSQASRGGPHGSSLLSAMAVPLPSSEDDLEDYSSNGSISEADVEPPLLRSVTHRRLVRLDQREINVRVQADDALLRDLASLSMGTNGSRQARNPRAQSSGASLDAGTSPSASTEKEKIASNSTDDDDLLPFYERTFSAEAPSTTSTVSVPEAGALVLGAEQQYVLPAPVACKLFPHQIEGVKWLWSLFFMKSGGILGDDMGLGKTMQCSAFLAGLFRSNLARTIIIVAPKTLIPHWLKELAVCGLRNLTREFSGPSESERCAALRSVTSGRGVIVTTYGMVQHNSQLLSHPAPRDGSFMWDIMLLDEGHKIKNSKTKLVEHLRKIPTRVRVVISGTPIQNNLMEMHSLFDFTTPNLLGDAYTFKKNYERPIMKGLDKEANERERQTGAAIAAQLRKRMEPFFLRREKNEVLKDSDNKVIHDTSNEGPSSSTTSGATAATQIGTHARALPRKNDLVVWLRLTPLQRKIYTAFLSTDSVRKVLNDKASPLAAITVLKKICDHPGLLSERAASSVIRAAHRWAKREDGHRSCHRQDTVDIIVYSDEEDDVSVNEVSDHGAQWGSSKASVAGGWQPNELRATSLQDKGPGLHSELARELEHCGPEASCKTAFVLALLEQLHAEGHRTLIFSQSKVMLDILQAGVKAMELLYCRIDGDVLSAEARQAHVHRFQNSNIPVFLLTSQVGGLGLTLTAADRVIVVDPAWNPSVDDQSVDRAYRMGQTRDVVVYRLVTCGTVEEKIYRRQVFKGGLFKTGTEEGIQFRYFTQNDLRDLFSVSTEGLQHSDIQAQLNKMHAHQRESSQEVKCHLERVLRMEGVAGIHDHNLLFSQRPNEPVPSAQEGQEILDQTAGAGLGLDALTTRLRRGLTLCGRNKELKVQGEMCQLRNEIARLSNEVRSKESLITSGQAEKLPDAGVRIKNCLLETRAKLETQRSRLAVLEAGSLNSETSVKDACADVNGLQTLLDSEVAIDQAPASHLQAGRLAMDSRRQFGMGLMSRSRSSTDSGTVSGPAQPLPTSAERYGPSSGPEVDHEESARKDHRVAAGSAVGVLQGMAAKVPKGAGHRRDEAPIAVSLDSDEALFITVEDAGERGGGSEDEGVIDLTGSP